MRDKPRRGGRLTLPIAFVVGLLMIAAVATARYNTAPSGQKIRPLPGSPSVKRTAREVVEFEGRNHSPKVGVKWKYFVEATNRSGHALAGKVRTQFLFSGTVVGREVPPYHKLRHGKLADTIVFPSETLRIQLTVQVVVTTRQGSVTLDWLVKPVKK